MTNVSIVFKSLYACQHRCGFCHVLHIPRNTSYMSTDEVKATFDVIEEKFRDSRVDLDLSGGEFALRKDAAQLVRYLRTKQIALHTLVLDTMGVPLADEALAQELGPLFTSTNFSFHSPDAETHALISASSTDFEELRAGLVNAFRYFPIVFINTSINRYNYTRLVEIARLVLDLREQSGRKTPLVQAYYLPVFREYGASLKENARRLQGTDNAQFLPPGDQLHEVAAQLGRARALLAVESVPAELRDFNYPACIYHAVTGHYPESAFGLTNFMTGTYFTDYAHPMQEEHSLESVYPSKSHRVKDAACAGCVAESVCPGVTDAWRSRGYTVQPVDEASYRAALPSVLFAETVQRILRDPRELGAFVEQTGCASPAVIEAFYAHLAGPHSPDVRAARDQISALPLEVRARGLCKVLRSLKHEPAALWIEAALGRSSLIADAKPTSLPPRTRLPVVA